MKPRSPVDYKREPRSCENRPKATTLRMRQNTSRRRQKGYWRSNHPFAFPFNRHGPFHLFFSVENSSALRAGKRSPRKPRAFNFYAFTLLQFLLSKILERSHLMVFIRQIASLMHTIGRPPIRPKFCGIILPSASIGLRVVFEVK